MTSTKAEINSQIQEYLDAREIGGPKKGKGIKSYKWIVAEKTWNSF